MKRAQVHGHEKKGQPHEEKKEKPIRSPKKKPNEGYRHEESEKKAFPRAFHFRTSSRFHGADREILGSFS